MHDIPLHLTVIRAPLFLVALTPDAHQRRLMAASYLVQSLQPSFTKCSFFVNNYAAYHFRVNNKGSRLHCTKESHCLKISTNAVDQVLKWAPLLREYLQNAGFNCNPCWKLRAFKLSSYLVLRHRRVELGTMVFTQNMWSLRWSKAIRGLLRAIGYYWWNSVYLNFDAI